MQTVNRPTDKAPAPPQSSATQMSKAPAWIVAMITAFGMLLMAIIAVGSIVMSGSNTDEAGAATSSEGSVSLSDFKISPDNVTVAAGDVKINVTNNGPSTHNFAIDGVGATKDLNSGESAVLSAGKLEPGTYNFKCTISGHADAGMKGTLTVVQGGGAKTAAKTAAANGQAAQGGSGTGSSATQFPPYQEVDAAHKKAVDQFLSGPPAKTEGVGGQDLQPRIVDGVKNFDVETKVVQWEVAPGKKVEAWTYNGTVPGPTIRVNVGDRVKVNLKNSLPQSTSIHFHGVEVPNSQDGVTFVTQDPVKPGDSFSYEFTAVNEGSHMYHSHHFADAQVPLGLVGAFIIGPPPVPVDAEYTEILTDGPLGFGINGKGFPATAPVVAKVGERTLVRFMNEGLIIHPMHLHGHRMLVVAKDGNKLASPYEVDTLNIAPGERYDVVVTSKYPGVWAFHCHILTHAESTQGLHGMTTVWVVKP